MKAVCQWQGAVWWRVVSDKKTLSIGQSNDTGLMIGCWCQAFKSGYRNFVMTKVDGGLRQVLDTWQRQCHADVPGIVWHVTSAGPRHISLSFSICFDKNVHTFGWPQRLGSWWELSFSHVHKQNDKEEYQCPSSVKNMSFSETLMLVIIRLKLFLKTVWFVIKVWL